MTIKLDISPSVIDRVTLGLSKPGPGVKIAVGQPDGVKVGINRTPPVQIELNARRTLDGSIMIFDHQSIDIVVIPEKNKVLTFAKDLHHDDVYGAQDRLGKFFVRAGIVDPSSVRSSNIFGSMEYSLLESIVPGVDSVQACLYTVYNYILTEKPYFDAVGDYMDKSREDLLQPGEGDSTELGDVPHADSKGAFDPRVRPYGYQYRYNLIR